MRISKKLKTKLTPVALALALELCVLDGSFSVIIVHFPCCHLSAIAFVITCVDSFPLLSEFSSFPFTKIRSILLSSEPEGSFNGAFELGLDASCEHLEPVDG